MNTSYTAEVPCWQGRGNGRRAIDSLGNDPMKVIEAAV